MTVSPVKIVFAVVAWVVVVFCASAYYAWHWLNTPQSVRVPENVYVIERGDTLYSVAADLRKNGVIRWPRLWVTYARLMGLQTIRAGEYRFAAKESPISLLARFQKGEHIQYQITLVEGHTLKDFIKTLHSHKKIKRLLDGVDYAELAEIFGLSVANPEGYFFPDTYHFVSGDSDKDILLRAHQRLNDILADEWQKRDSNLPYSSAYEALIMASIVEKETGAAFERKQIAGVFVRRLKKNMRLQTDPTVIYGMGENYLGNITRKDLKTPTPYNTYTIKGLPPTPIANPGKAAIHAALQPAGGKALYFVAKGDGTHYFSETLREHEKAVNKYQKQRRQNYRSTPIESNQEASRNTP